MKKQILIIIGIAIIISIIGLTVAGITGIIKFPSLQKVNIGIDQSVKTSLQDNAGVDTIDIQKSPIICNANTCWSDVYQENLIQTQWRGDKSYCSSYSQIDKGCINGNQTYIEENNLSCSQTCLEYSDYTSNELIQNENDWIQGRLTDYANSIQDQQDNSDNTQQVTGDGSIGADISGSGGTGIKQTGVSG